MVKLLAAAVLALLLGACASSSIYSGSAGKTLVVSKGDWEGYQSYLSKVGSTNAGAFVIRVFGGKSDGYGYVDCPESDCISSGNYVTQAMAECHQGGSSECVLFARSSTIIVNYRVEN